MVPSLSRVRLVVLVASVVAASCGQRDSSDAEVELNTAVGRREAAGETAPVVTLPIVQETTSTTTEPVAPASSVQPTTLSETTTSATPTAAPRCVELAASSVVVVSSENGWSLEASTTAGESVVSGVFPLEGDPPIVIGSAQLDDDDSLEVLIGEVADAEASWVRVFDFARCRLEEPLDAVSGQPVKMLVGRLGDAAGGVACDGPDVVVTALTRSGGGDDAIGPSFDGYAVVLSLFSGLWERGPEIPSSFGPDDVAGVTGLYCSDG